MSSSGNAERARDTETAPVQYMPERLCPIGMKLRSADESEFHLSIVGYEFPKIAPSDYDSNWLMVTIRSKIPRGAWEATSPALETWDVKELAEWLDEVANDGDFEKELGSVGHLLAFHYVERRSDLIHLRIGFGLEFRPAWSDPNRVDPESNMFDFIVSPTELKRASIALREDLERFPIR